MTKLIKYFDNLNKILDAKERRDIINIYNIWVEEQPSIIDGDSRVGRPHHVRTANNSGTGMRPHDLWQVPITNRQHQKQEQTHRAKYQVIFLDKLPELHDRFVDENNIII